MKISSFIRAISLLVVFLMLWWSFTDGSMEQFWFGFIVAVLATVLTMRILEGERFPIVVRIKTLARFVPYFIYESVKGGVLVAKLAVLPQRLVRSEYIEYETRIPQSADLARMWFASTICIFPGTLSCGYKGDSLVIHVLDIGLLDMNSIQELEKIIGAIFDAELVLKK